MKYCLILFVICFLSHSFAEEYNILINSTNLICGESPSVKCYGDIMINDESMLIENSSGTISLVGSWINNGDFSANTGTVRFFGDQETSGISGNIVTTFSNLAIDKSDEDKTLSPIIDVYVRNDLNIIKGTLFVEDISIEVWNNMNIYFGGILENKSDLPYLIKVFGSVYNNSELNNDGWLEIGVEE